MGQTAAAISYESNAQRKLFILGHPKFVQNVASVLAPIDFIQNEPISEFHNATKEHFGVFVWDTTSGLNTEVFYRAMRFHCSMELHKIVYIADTKPVGTRDILFCQGLGARYVAWGPERDNHLRAYIKRHVLEVESHRMCEKYERELATLKLSSDSERLHLMTHEILDAGKNKEPILALLAKINYKLRRYEKVLHYLKGILSINRQNLWALNWLTLNLLRSVKLAEANDVIENLTDYNDEASRLTAPLLGRLPPDFDLNPIIEFLSMRGIVCAHTQRPNRALEHYEAARQLARSKPKVAAVIQVNLVLCLARFNRLIEAREILNSISDSVSASRMTKIHQAINNFQSSGRPIGFLEELDLPF